mmetsp:Transcript_119301/g.207653  ORF Transcript_119301/g.207653 Transcript_119301/m.207653 type:complete len:235 (+) Transcript_119301:880-1584(+)
MLLPQRTTRRRLGYSVSVYRSSKNSNLLLASPRTSRLGKPSGRSRGTRRSLLLFKFTSSRLGRVPKEWNTASFSRQLFSRASCVRAPMKDKSCGREAMPLQLRSRRWRLGSLPSSRKTDPSRVLYDRLSVSSCWKAAAGHSTCVSWLQCRWSSSREASAARWASWMLFSPRSRNSSLLKKARSSGTTRRNFASFSTASMASSGSSTLQASSRVKPSSTISGWLSGGMNFIMLAT